MKKYKISAVFLMITLFLVCDALWAETTVIVNKSVQENTFSKEEIKNIFLGNKTKWGNSRMIKFVIQKPGPTHKKFLKTFVGRSTRQYKMTIRKQVFLGKGNFPLAFATDKKMIEYVAENENTIGYVASDKINDTVKIIEIK